MSTTAQGTGDNVGAMIFRMLVAILTSGAVSAWMLRRAMKAEAALLAEKGARQLAEADLAAARDELAARAGERRLLALAKRDEAGEAPRGDRPSPTPNGLIAGGQVSTLRIRLRERRKRL